MKKWTKTRFSRFFDDKFGFEKGIDISDETQVLYRRNVVIKNIIFLSNMLYTVLLMVLSLLNMQSSSWILTFVLFPLTFLINSTLNKHIKRYKDDHVHQQIAMYLACFYMFGSSVLVYMKMKNSNVSFGEAGYILIYYSLVVVSLYQDRKMLKTISLWVVVLITILHFTVTYNLINSGSNESNISQIISFFTSKEVIDIGMRTIVLILFMVVLYVIVGISQYMQDERKKELVKRKEVEEDFTKVVTEMFKVTLNDRVITSDDIKQIKIVSEMVKTFSQILGDPDDIVRVNYKFSRIHLDSKVDLDLSNLTDKDAQFSHLRSQTELGNTIVRRLELSRRCEDIIRTHEEVGSDIELLNKIKEAKLDEQSQVVLVCEMYTTLRSVRNYKRPINHRLSIDIMEKEFKAYFDSYIFERFIRFQDKFEDIFDNFKEE